MPQALPNLSLNRTGYGKNREPGRFAPTWFVGRYTLDMGEYFVIVNIDKRQYLSAASMNENNKRGGFLRGLHGRALALLVCKSDELRHGYGELAGSWFGDRVIATGDDNGVPDAYDMVTRGVETPDRNLYELARQEYDDISLAAVVMLCRGDRTVVDELVTAAGKSDGALLVVGDAVFVAQYAELGEAMRAQHGEGWVRRYQRACDASSWRQNKTRPN